MANSDNSRLLGQLGSAEKERDALRAELDALKQSREEDLKGANNAGFLEAKESYTKQVRATQEIFFKAGWKAACEQLGQGSGTDVFATPPAVSLLSYLMPYANDVFTALQVEAEEACEEQTEEQAELKNHTAQPGQTATGAQDQTPTVNLEAAEDEFTDLSPLA